MFRHHLLFPYIRRKLPETQYWCDTGASLQLSIWDRVKANIKRKNPDNRMLDTFVDPIVLLREDPTPQGLRIRLGVPSKLHEDFVSERLLGSICEEISSEMNGAPFQVDIEVNPGRFESNDPHPSLSPDQLNQNAGSQAHSHSSSGFIQTGANGAANHPGQQTPSSPSTRPLLFNSEYTFKTFVVGKNNEFAHAACFSVAENPGKKVNPLFICGPTGMGKTHLLSAVGNHILDVHGQLRIRYVGAERFFNECIQCIRRNDMDSFRGKYREQCDVLLIDDVQILGRGEAVQEEFFNTFNSLFERGRQVVVASDRMPSDIKGLEDRIRTRFEWGVIADIQMPDLETRFAILRYKAETRGMYLADDVIDYIARISRRSIRELEGNLNKVKMFTELQGIPINIENTRKILATHNMESNHLTMEEIQRIVAQHFEIRPQDLKGQNRSKPIVTARQMAMYLAKKYLDKSLMDIGRAFGGKDHTTVINAIRRIEEQMEKNSDMKKDYNELQTRIHNITGV